MVGISGLLGALGALDWAILACTFSSSLSSSSFAGCHGLIALSLIYVPVISSYHLLLAFSALAFCFLLCLDGWLALFPGGFLVNKMSVWGLLVTYCSWGSASRALG